jgi:hypothetical protein
MSFKACEDTQRYDRALMQIPHEWRGPVVDVVDTFDIVKMGLKSIGIEDSFLLADAVRMVLERHDKGLGVEEEL